MSGTPEESDWTRVDATTDEDIARQIAEDPDTAPDMSRWDWSKARVVRPVRAPGADAAE